MTELSVEGLQQALVVCKSHLIQDQVNSFLVIPESMAQILSCGKKNKRIAVRPCEINLDLPRSLSQ